MARTGPQKIPGANLSLFFGGGRRYTGSDMEVNCGIVHTTEGATLYDYGGGAEAPTVTAVPDLNARRLVWYQHFDVDESARALVNASGGVQTNTANAFQIELVGTCDPATHAVWARRGIDHIYWPEPPDWAVQDLAWLMRWLRDQHGIPLASGLEWLPYPTSYGASRARMSFAQWTRFKGWAGHQHVPENDHGDPGNLPINRILAAATGAVQPPSTSAPGPNPVQEDDMSADDLFNTRVPEAVLPNGYVPRFIELVEGGGQANDLIKQFRADLPEIIRAELNTALNAPIDWAALPTGYKPSLREMANGAKEADDRIAKLTDMVATLSASIDQLKLQLTTSKES
jgi:hypothetical protein